MSHPRSRDKVSQSFMKTTGQLPFLNLTRYNKFPNGRISYDRSSWIGSTKSSVSSSKNFIKINTERAIASRPRYPALRRVDSPHGTRVPLKESGMEPNYLQKSDYGKLPKYLRRVKQEKVQISKDCEEKVEEIVEIGEKLQYSEDEKEQVVFFLEDYLKELNKKYQTLPLAMDTIGKQQRKHELESLMDEVQRSILFMKSNEVIIKSEFPPPNSNVRNYFDEMNIEEYKQPIDNPDVW